METAKASTPIGALKEEYLNGKCERDIIRSLQTLGTLINYAKQQRRNECDGYVADRADCNLGEALENLGKIGYTINTVYELIEDALKYDEGCNE